MRIISLMFTTLLIIVATGCTTTPYYYEDYDYLVHVNSINNPDITSGQKYVLLSANSAVSNSDLYFQHPTKGYWLREWR